MGNKNTHGGDIISAQSEYGGEILDFSVNINPLGIPESVRQAAANADFTRYPDPLCRELTAGISARDKVPEVNIICGNGAADIIYRLAMASRPETALLTAPTFSDYEEALKAIGCKTAYHRLSEEEDFDLTERFLPELEVKPDIVFLCNPNNPTGRLIRPELLMEIMEICGRHRIRLVVDECFLELSSGSESGGLAAYLNNNPQLVLLRAFTKSMAIPGLRLGYGLCADTELLDGMVRCGQSWGVSEPAQAAGIAALREAEHTRHARELLAIERPWLVGRLRELGLKVYEPAANYILFRAMDVADLKERMIKRGILIRSCSNYVNLGDDYYRVAVREHGDNERLIDSLKDALLYSGET